MSDRCSLLTCAVLCLAPLATGQEADFVWDAEAAEHLLSRAGFGARPTEIEAAVELGRDAFVEALLAGPEVSAEPFLARSFSPRDSGALPPTAQGRSARRGRRAAGNAGMPTQRPGSGEGDAAEGSMDPEPSMDAARQEAARKARRDDGHQLGEFRGWWVEQMMSGDDALRERMALFWHGHFTSGYQEVKSSSEMIRQNELFRRMALGNFGDLVREIARDPAMLEYLDNDANRVGNPNENFARELMELFTLGEGNYTEEDVREVARAFTGWTDRGGEFAFERRHHDFDRKTVLGVTGKLDGDDVIDILLEQEACADWVAGRILGYLEGAPPAAARRAEYAEHLRANDYEISAMLQRLFLDDEFYRAEVRGQRVASPVDFLVGAARRLGINPPAQLVAIGASILGEALLDPPNVKGWEGGLTWITTSSLMTRGNLAGVMLGVVDVEAIAIDPELEAMLEEGSGMEPGMASDPSMGGGADSGPRAKLAGLGRDYRGLSILERISWRPRLHMATRLAWREAHTDAECVDTLLDELLAVRVSGATRAGILQFLKADRVAAGVAEGDWLGAGPKAEDVLRRTAHLILSLPEAQLH